MPPRSQVAFVKVAECLYRNPSSKTYFALFKHKGKQIRKSLRTQDRKLAGRRLQELKAAVGALNVGREQRRLEFGTFARRWLEVNAPRLKSSSAARLALIVRQLAAAFAGKALVELESGDCEQWAAKRVKKIAAATFNTDLQVLKRILQDATDKGLLLINPADRIKRARGQSRTLAIPSQDEFARLCNSLAQTPQAEDALRLVKLLALSGMRLSEATELRWEDINFAKGRFTITGGAGGTKNYEARVVPLFPNLQGFLQGFRRRRGKLVPIRSAKKAIGQACKKADLPHFSHHCLRHYFVSNAIERGVDFKTIASWVGHKDGGLLVAKTYGHLRDTHSMEMAQRMQGP